MQFVWERLVPGQSRALLPQITVREQDTSVGSVVFGKKNTQPLGASDEV